MLGGGGWSGRGLKKKKNDYWRFTTSDAENIEINLIDASMIGEALTHLGLF